MDGALELAYSVLRTGVQGVTDLIVHPGLINLGQLTRANRDPAWC